MYMNKKLCDTIADKFNSRISNYSNFSPEIRKFLTSVVEDSILESIEEVWDESGLAERCGPHLWEYLHWIGKVADNEDNPDLYYNALEVLKEGHPCKDLCRPHLKDNLEKINPDDYSSCFEHSYDLHNLVNEQLGKESPTFEEVDLKYDLNCDSCSFVPSEKNNNFLVQVENKNVIQRETKNATNVPYNSTTKPRKIIDASTNYFGDNGVRNTSRAGLYQSIMHGTYRQ